MQPEDVARLSDWLVRRGLEGTAETDLLRELCERCNAAGLPLARAGVIIDTLHPVHEGTVFRWRNDNVEEQAATRYGRTTEGEAAESWQRSPFHHLLQSGGEELRRRIAFGDPIDFPSVQDLQDTGHTDYIVFVHRVAREAAIGEMDYIGSVDRLDFTVVGPAVNETSRIASMCRSVDRPMLVSADFAAAAPPGERARLVSVGRFALRGVGRAKEPFTLDPELL